MVQDTVIMIINYDRHMFIVQATEFDFFLFSVKITRFFVRFNNPKKDQVDNPVNPL